jgi:hypothetical protein
VPRFFFVWLLVLPACNRWPDSYPPPTQRPALPGTETPLGAFVHMNSSQAGAHLVRDVSVHVESGNWRWTYKRPELKFYLPRTDRLNFSMDFSVPEATFAQTGPVTFTFLVNGVVLDRLRVHAPGPKSYRKAVPARMLKAGELNHVVIEPDKVFVAGDGAKLGFVLISAGFVE